MILLAYVMTKIDFLEFHNDAFVYLGWNKDANFTPSKKNKKTLVVVE